MTPKSFSVRIFLQDGHADGVKIVSKSKWTGRCMVIPRPAFVQEKARKELNAAGVYTLTGPRNGAKQQILRIGAADPVYAQLAKHDEHDKEWSEAIIFTCRESGPNPAQFYYMASCLQQLLLKSGKDSAIKVDELPQTELSKAEKSAADEFITHILSLYPLLGVTSFE